MEIAQVLQYYGAHSPLTDPGVCAALYDVLPRDLDGLVQVVQGVLIHPGPGVLGLYGLEPQDIDNTVFGLHRVADLLQRIQRRHDARLGEPRPPVLRIGANCRNFAVLLVSMLRHQGVPARLRVGFGGYFGSSRWYDHRVAEYWDGLRQQWVLADPMIDDYQRRARKITFNTLDIGPGDPFLVAGEVWRCCRAGKLDPEGFSDSDTDIGMPPIRYALLHDFAALNKHEVLGCDNWGDLSTKPDPALTGDDLALLDRIADATLAVDTDFELLTTLFDETAYGQTVHAGLAALV